MERRKLRAASSAIRPGWTDNPGNLVQLSWGSRSRSGPPEFLQSLLVRRFVPGKTPGIVKTDIQTPSEIESAGHERSPFLQHRDIARIFHARGVVYLRRNMKPIKAKPTEDQVVVRKKPFKLDVSMNWLMPNMQTSLVRQCVAQRSFGPLRRQWLGETAEPLTAIRRTVDAVAMYPRMQPGTRWIFLEPPIAPPG